jgi:hypothetical protein
MVVHWKRTKGKFWRQNIFINGLGTLITGITAIIVLMSKFFQGAWVLLLLIPMMLQFMRSINRHYTIINKQIICNTPLPEKNLQSPIVVVLASEDWNNVTFKALHAALALSEEIIILHVNAEDQESNLQKKWIEFVEEPLMKMKLPIPKLEVLRSPYRLVVAPIVDYVFTLENKHTQRQIAVLIPNLIEKKWHQRFLHNQRGILLAQLLMYKGGKRIIIIQIPWYLEEK